MFTNSIFDVPFGEKERILKLHENATKNHYLFKEQKIVTNVGEEEIFELPNNTFPSGEYSNFNKEAVNTLIENIKQYIQKFPLNQKFDITIESSESKVPNKSVGLAQGDLSKLRAKEMENYLKTKFEKNVNFTIDDKGAQGPEWTPPSGANKDEIQRLARQKIYTDWQYVKFRIKVRGEKQVESCGLGFTIIVDYRKEWCKAEDQSRCHKCDEALFKMWANNIPLTTSDGNDTIDLNNNIGSEMSGPSRVVKLVVSREQKRQILERNPNEILITYGCAIDKCHSDPVHITILDSLGKVLLPPRFITTGGKKLSNSEKPIKLLMLNKCSEVIAISGEKGLDSEEPNQITNKPKVKAFVYDGTTEKLFDLYKMVEPNGTFSIPTDKMELFRSFKMFNGKPWSELSEYLDLTNRDMKDLKKYIETKNLQ